MLTCLCVADWPGLLDYAPLRYSCFARQDFFDGRRTVVSVREVKMTEKKCHERAAVLQFLFVLCPDFLCGSPSGRVSTLCGHAPVCGPCVVMVFRALGPCDKCASQCLSLMMEVACAAWQMYLRLLGLYSTLLRALQSDTPWTIAGLNSLQRDVVVPFVLLYEMFALGIESEMHCPASLFGRLSSIFFVKLHALMHMVEAILNYGFCYNWCTGSWDHDRPAGVTHDDGETVRVPAVGG